MANRTSPPTARRAQCPVLYGRLGLDGTGHQSPGWAHFASDTPQPQTNTCKNLCNSRQPPFQKQHVNLIILMGLALRFWLLHKSLAVVQRCRCHASCSSAVTLDKADEGRMHPHDAGAVTPESLLMLQLHFSIVKDLGWFFLAQELPQTRDGCAMVHMIDRGLPAWGTGTHTKYVMKCACAHWCEQMTERAEVEFRLRSETKLEQRLLGLVTLGHLFLSSTSTAILQQPPQTPSVSELLAVPWRAPKPFLILPVPTGCTFSS